MSYSALRKRSKIELFLDSEVRNLSDFVDVIYNPTLDNIKLTPEQEHLMLQAIEHIEDAPTAIKKTTRWQFWFRQIWDQGYLSGMSAANKVEP